MKRQWWPALATLLSLTVPRAAVAGPCVMVPAEKAWVEGALQASDYVMEQRLHLPREAHPTIVVFNDRCRFELGDAGRGRWIGTSHTGKIDLFGTTIDAGVTSFASDDDKTGRRFFVMALPPVWAKAKVMEAGDKGLTAVFLHEFSHTRQMTTLAPVFQAADARYHAPDLNDDSLQGHFKTDPAYVAVYEKESDLLYRAAAEPDDAKARAFAVQALKLIDARQKRWFTGADAMWKPYDDVFLTLEGFGQWNGYAWLSDPRGGAMTADAAREKMRGKRKWWSQEEGLGLFLVIDRFVPNWASQAFGSPPKLGIDLLREAVAARPASAMIR
jgi:hypothetical protein